MVNGEDGHLIREFLNGNTRAFEELVSMYHSDVYRFCYFYVRDRTEVEDLCQEIFFSVYKNLHSFRYEVPFKSWLFKITYNKCMDFLRRKSPVEKNQYMLEEDSQSPPTLPHNITVEQNSISMDLKRIISYVLKQLPEKTRNIVELFYYSKFSCKEIAYICHMSEGAVKTALSRARETLKEKLMPYFKQELLR